MLTFRAPSLAGDLGCLRVKFQKEKRFLGNRPQAWPKSLRKRHLESLHFFFLLFCPSLNRPPGQMGFRSYLNLKYLPGASLLNPINIFLLLLLPSRGSLEGFPKRGENGLCLVLQGLEARKRELVS